MNTWVRKSWLYNIKVICLTLSLTFFILSCKKRIKEVEINVFDIQTKQGVEGVMVYHNDAEYQSDANGKVFLSKKWNYRGQEVHTNFGLKEHFNPGFYKNCELNNKHVIQSETVPIPVSVSKVLKIKIDIASGTESRLGCFILDDLPECSGEFHQYFERYENYLDIPGKVGWDRSKDYLTYFMVQSPEPATIKVYYDCKDGWDNNSIEPDIFEEIELDVISDTTYYTLVLR